MKNKILSVAIAAGLSLGLSNQAAASVYAGARVDIQNLLIDIQTPNGAVIPGEFTFNTNSSATLNGASSAPAANTCGTVAGPACSAVAPVLDSLANAPGSNPVRSAGDFSFFGPDQPIDTETYANAHARIGDAQLATGNPSSATQISEVELQGTGSGSADTLVSSTTQFGLGFTLPSTGSLDLSFLADIDLFVSVDTPDVIAAIAQANSDFTFSLQGDNGVNITWSSTGFKTGIQGFDFTSCTAAVCAEIQDNENLGQTIGLPPGSPSSAGYSDNRQSAGADLGLQDFEIALSNLAAGQYSLDLTINTSVNAQQTVAVPEPSNIALFGMGLLGMGFVQRRKSLKKG